MNDNLMAVDATTQKMRCLSVHSPYAEMIVDGRKKKEFRTRNTKIRGRIGIIATGSGCIIGEAELYDCTYDAKNCRYVWHLRHAERCAKPKPYKHNYGAVVWVWAQVPR